MGREPVGAQPPPPGTAGTLVGPHRLLPECDCGLTAWAPRGGGTGDRDLLPLGAPLDTLWLLLFPLPSPHASAELTRRHKSPGLGRWSSSLQLGLALGRPPLWDPALSPPGLWDGRLRPACQGGGLSKKQQINYQRRWGPSAIRCHTGRREPVWPLPAQKKTSFFSLLKAVWKMKPPFLRVPPSQRKLPGTHSCV